MKNQGVAGFALVVCLVVGGAGYLFAPALQNSARTNHEEASRKVEEARRLLSLYNAGVERVASLTAGAATGAEQAVEKARDEAFATLYQDEVDATVDAFGLDRSRRPTGPIDKQLRDGAGSLAALVAENDRLLADALTAVSAAISLAPEHAPANRLKGAILYFQGQSLARKSAAARVEALAARDRVAAAAAAVAAVQPRTTLVSNSGINEELTSMESQLATHQAAAGEVKRELAGLETNIARLEGELAAATAEADAARARMEEMSRKGMDLSRQDGYAMYDRDYSAAAETYRRALSRIHAINHGTLPNATIDASGDYLRGAYQENGRSENLTAAPGLSHYRAERERVAAAVASADEAVSRYQERIGRLKGILATYQQQQTTAASSIQSDRAAGTAAIEELIRASDEAGRIEGEAIRKFTQAAGAYRTAESSADAAVRDAAEASRSVTTEAEAVSSVSIVKDDSWIGAHIATEQAAAETAAAWQHYQQYQHETANAELLASAAPALGASDATAEARRALAEQARTAGLGLARSAGQIFQRSHGKLGRNWTVVAEYAGTAYLLVLFGERQHLKDVIANYRNAIAGREATPAAAPFKERLSKLEKMQ